MTIINKISALKYIKDMYFVKKSKYDRVCDELSYREMQVDKLKKSIDVFVDEKVISSKTIDNLTNNNSNLANIISDLKMDKNDLIVENSRIYSKVDDLHIGYEKLKEYEKFLKYLWSLIAFSGGVLFWEFIIKFL